MRVRQISVKNLFGTFNHSIQLNTEERITIIHGPNGFGKTALLRLVDGLLNLHYSQLRSIPYDEFRVDFDDRSALQIDQERLEEEVSPKFQLIKPDSETLSFSPRLVDRLRLLPNYSSITSMDLWPLLKEMYKSDEESSEPENVTRFVEGRKEPEWLEAVRKQVPVRFIQTQRLFSSENHRPVRKVAESPATSTQPAVEKYAKELAGIISAKLAESAELSQSLDRTFPVRLVSGNAPLALNTEELRQRLSKLEEKRERLTAVGLLDQDNDADFQIPTQIDETKRSVLSIYVNDAEKKLDVFDDMADRIELFRNIVNRRFLYKQMTVNREKGFIFTTSDNKPLPSSALSSGEQHELVLLYELLFEVKPGSLILIDEPELSLHVAWQQQFLKDLQEITKLSSIDVLIATHSPQIIHDRWDLTVELTGPAR